MNTTKKTLLVLAIIAGIFALAIFTYDSNEGAYRTVATELHEAKSLSEISSAYELLQALHEADTTGHYTHIYDSLVAMRPQHEERVAKEERSNNHYRSYALTKSLIEQNLKAPSTAKWQPYREATRYFDEPATYGIRMWVEAQNSFGAQLRTTYYASWKIINDKWQLVDFKEV